MRACPAHMARGGILASCPHCPPRSNQALHPPCRATIWGPLLVAVVMMALGWFGIAEIVSGSGPTLRTVFQLLLLLFFATSGTAMPFVFYANVRFVPVTRSVPPSGVIVRQSAWVGFFVVGCACLQLLYIGADRALTPLIALVLAAALRRVGMANPAARAG